MTYPLPSYAASIWIAGDEVYLAFPSPVESARTHTVHFPATERGLRLALRILHERERDQPRTLGNRAAPPQYDVEALYRAIATSEPAKRLQATAKEKAEAEAFLAELGL